MIDFTKSKQYTLSIQMCIRDSTDLSNGIGKTIENITDDRMSRSEENFFESNAYLALKCNQSVKLIFAL